MRTINIDGRLGKDAEMLTTPAGRKYVRFRVANNSYVGGKEETTWFDVSSFDEFVLEKKFDILKKGVYVNITGPFQIKENVDNGKLYLNYYITANSIEIPNIGRRNENTSDGEGTFKMSTGATAYSAIKVTPSAPQKEEVKVTSTNMSFNSQDDDDELPF